MNNTSFLDFYCLYGSRWRSIKIELVSLMTDDGIDGDYQPQFYLFRGGVGWLVSGAG